MLGLIGAVIATFALVVRRPMTFLAKIQIALTALVIVAFVVGMKMATWLHSMAGSDPVRKEWQPRFDVIGPVLWFGTIIPWLLFTVIHAILVLKRKTTTKPVS